MTFRDRLAGGYSHEQAVRNRLASIGWTCEHIGQGAQSSEMRNALRKTASPIRWGPDLLAVRGDDVRLLDAKAETRKDTSNFSIEFKAWEAAMMAPWGIRVAFVFADFSANYADVLGVDPRFDVRLDHSSGSGTPYVLVLKEDQIPFDQFFGG